jgi:CRP-like cAMP-binding protein
MVSFEADQIIFREADIGKFLYLVDSGQVAIEIRVPGQGRTTILTVGPGELLGWSSLFPSGRKTAGARTVTATRAIAVDAQRLRDTMFEDHDLGCAILWRITDVIAGRLKATRLQLLDIFAPSSAL